MGIGVFLVLLIVGSRGWAKEVLGRVEVVDGLARECGRMRCAGRVDERSAFTKPSTGENLRQDLGWDLRDREVVGSFREVR